MNNIDKNLHIMLRINMLVFIANTCFAFAYWRNFSRLVKVIFCESGEMADAPDLGSGGQPPCGFKSRLSHQNRSLSKYKYIVEIQYVKN